MGQHRLERQRDASQFAAGRHAGHGTAVVAQAELHPIRAGSVNGHRFDADAEARFGQSQVVETYVSYLRKKLEVGGPPVIHTVRLVGYALREPATE